MRYLVIMTLLLIAYAVLAGCAAQEPVTVYKTVQVPVAVSCISKLPERPPLKNNDELRALDSGAFVIEIAAERLDLLTYADLMDAAVTPCK